MHRLLSFVLALVLLASPAFSSYSLPDGIRRDLHGDMIRDLDVIKGLLYAGYAPAQWKSHNLDWDLDAAIAKAKEQVLSIENITLKDYHIILRDFFNSMADYHVSVHFWSMEYATLPIAIGGAEGRYFITRIDTDKLNAEKFPLKAGDEVISFDGRPVADVVTELMDFQRSANAQTDQAIAEITLTMRSGESGMVVPKGPVVIGVKGTDGKVREYQLVWEYKNDDASLRYSSLANALADTSVAKEGYLGQRLDSYLNQNSTAVPLYSDMVKRANPQGAGEIGGKSPLPELGIVLWTYEKEPLKVNEEDIPSIDSAADDEKNSGISSSFQAYIYVNNQGKKVGYLRIPHYRGSNDLAAEFAAIMKKFEAETELLVIDQLNNGGGSIVYMYGLLSMLTDHALVTPRHMMTINPQMVVQAKMSLEILGNIHSDQDAVWAMGGEQFFGYTVSYQMIELLRGYFQFIIDEWEAGKTVTTPTYLLGIDRINPNVKVVYTKPILVLVNELDFSCGDFLPAILQDSGRAVIMGATTAGAGGFVQSQSYLNTLGVSGFSYTGSLVIRPNGDPIENIGVVPDVPYSVTVKDLQDKYSDYVKAISVQVASMLKD